MKKKRTFETYWRASKLDSTLVNVSTPIFYGIKRQAKAAYLAGRKHEKARKP